ncbi:hypothetical protein ACFLT9_03495 [Acidobacteriota bacterium]
MVLWLTATFISLRFDVLRTHSLREPLPEIGSINYVIYTGNVAGNFVAQELRAAEFTFLFMQRIV